MKKGTFAVILLLSGIVYLLSSCKKDYHCTCTYNNQVVYTKDLGNQVQSDANSACSAYDTTVSGEQWNCTIY